MIYFTSDLHLGHANAIDFKSRPFSNVEEMNISFINNINDTVEVNDELWILGDFALNVNREEVRKFRKDIKCKHVHLVRGNHDKDYSQDHIFQSFQTYKELKTEYGLFILFHYPILEWNAAHYGSIHLHGHIHSSVEYNLNNRLLRYEDRFTGAHTPKRSLNLRIYDVGVDANEYRPISIEEIAKFLNLT